MKHYRRLFFISFLMALAIQAFAHDLHSWDEQISDNSRFIVLKQFNDEAVLDKETSLVWQKSPSTSTVGYPTARIECARAVIGQRMGWRLPSFSELTSLIDVPETPPSLPNGHPFVGIQTAKYWTGTVGYNSTVTNPSAWVVDFSNANVGPGRSNEGPFLMWCVRGGSPGPDYY